MSEKAKEKIGADIKCCQDLQSPLMIHKSQTQMFDQQVPF